MPRGFSDAERERIRAGLLAAGRDMLARYGMRKTSVEDLTRAAGISKGAFYQFFDSKEELFFAILREFEAEYRDRLLSDDVAPDLAPRERLRAFLRRAFGIWKQHPLFRHFGQTELDLLMRRLPPEQLQAGLADDERFMEQLRAYWAGQGMHVATPPRLLAALMRAMFFVSVHEADFAPDIYPQLIDQLTDMLAAHLLGPEGQNHDQRA